MDLIRLGDAIESGTCYRYFMDKIRFILVVSIVLSAIAVLGILFAQRKRNLGSSTTTN
jgi:cell division protein FtsL